MALQLNQPASEQLLGAYHRAMREETDTGEWNLFCDQAVKRFGWTYLPGVPKLLDALREFRGQPSLDSEAVQAYEAVIAAGVYTPEGGTSWTYRGVLELCGRAAADAWLEAGGNSAFSTTWAEHQRRERFIAAYVAGARAEPTARLLQASPGELKTLPPRARPPLFPSALSLVRKIAGLAGEGLPPEERPAAGTVVKTDERVAELRAQLEASEAAKEQEVPV